MVTGDKHVGFAGEVPAEVVWADGSFVAPVKPEDERDLRGIGMLSGAAAIALMLIPGIVLIITAPMSKEHPFFNSWWWLGGLLTTMGGGVALVLARGAIIKKAAIARIASRSELLFQPDDDCMYVSIEKPATFHKLKLKTEDMGLLKVLPGCVQLEMGRHRAEFHAEGLRARLVKGPAEGMPGVQLTYGDGAHCWSVAMCIVTMGGKRGSGMDARVKARRLLAMLREAGAYDETAAEEEAARPQREKIRAITERDTRRFAIYVLAPAVVMALAANFFIPNPSKKDLKAYIAKAMASGNDGLAEREYETLARSDVNNVENQRGYISLHYSLPKHQSKSKDRDDTRIVSYYTELADSNTPWTANVGRYGLGLIESLEDNHTGALEWFGRIDDPNMPYVNNSIGHCYKEMGEPNTAEGYLWREIEMGGNVGGAVSNLTDIYTKRGDAKALRRLMDDKRCAEKVGLGTRRRTAWLEGDVGEYANVVATLYKRNATIDGLAAALLICGVWMTFIRRLDIFEKESAGPLLAMLGAGAACALAGFVVYDLTGITLGFDLGKGALHQLAYCIFGIGVIEESIKLLPVLAVLLLTRRMNESTDYMIYASMSALGFALMENIGYFNRYGLDSIGGRAFTSTLFHMALTSLAIYGLVYAKYKGKSLWYFGASFAGACALHGLFDFFIIGDGFVRELRVVSLAVLIITILLYARAFRNALGASEFFAEADSEAHFQSNAFLLMCGLSYVLIVQYLILALRFGPELANRRIVGMLFISYLIIAIIWGQFMRMRPGKGEWVSIFGRGKK